MRWIMPECIVPASLFPTFGSWFIQTSSNFNSSPHIDLEVNQFRRARLPLILEAVRGRGLNAKEREEIRIKHIFSLDSSESQHWIRWIFSYPNHSRYLHISDFTGFSFRYWQISTGFDTISCKGVPTEGNILHLIVTRPCNWLPNRLSTKNKIQTV